MSARITVGRLLLAGMSLLLSSQPSSAALAPLDQQTLADQLGWSPTNENHCGGYYLEQPFTYADDSERNKTVGITGSQALFSQRGTTVLEGKVSLVRFGQQITADKAYIYRDQTTGKMTSMDLQGDVHLREPNTMVIAKRGHYSFTTKDKTLMDILYRTSLTSGKQIAGPKITADQMQQERKVTGMIAWGAADEFAQNEPKVYELSRTSFSTCPPVNPAWRVKASHLVLNKNTGRGYATHARIFVKDVPVFYIPYLNFSIDHQRKSGFLWPTVSNRTSSSNIYAGSGMIFAAPFYWNMAPNYDMTITPAYLSWRGVRLSDKFRYLSSIGHGDLNVSVLPGDQYFGVFQEYARTTYTGSTNNVIQAELSRLLNASSTRKGLSWRDDTHLNTHWSTHVDFNYAGDDYYLRDFGSNPNEFTQNQLLQIGELFYKSENWNFITRLQTYQVLHPIDGSQVDNQYMRFPQLILDGDYPDQALGLEYFIKTEATHFDIRNTPGTAQNQPIGNRLHLQPGISLPVYQPYFFFNPRMQVSMTGYNLYQTNPTNAPTSAQRTIPIFDLATGLALSRDMTLFTHGFEQTLEPQIYYTYIPYRNQASIPIFDTTVSTLTYDQIFNYNRFSGIDRIGDANQIGFGVATKLLDSETGLEKVRLGVGVINYFSNRRVTFCNGTSCTDNPFNPANHWRLSPVSAVLNYAVNPEWNLESNAIINPISKQLSNTAIGVHYKSDERHLLNLGYGYVFNGDPLSGSTENTAANNLKLTDLSFSWPVTQDLSAVGRWSQNWNQQHLQNMLYGLQYDTCCWAVRFVGGRAFIGLNPTQNNKPIYNDEYFIQFSLKGLGDIGSGDPTGLLSTIAGYKSQFGQEF